MIISEKQIMQLITIVHGYVTAMHRMGQYKNVEIAQDLLVTINDQQPNVLKEIKDE
jgi:hypothetical protein